MPVGFRLRVDSEVARAGGPRDRLPCRGSGDAGGEWVRNVVAVASVRAYLIRHPSRSTWLWLKLRASSFKG